MVNDSGILPSLFEDLDDDDIVPVCAAHQLCCDPNSDTKEYHFCINCNKEAHTICTKQMDFQTPVLDESDITQNDFNNTEKERFKKMLTSKRHNIVFCLLCKALHPTKKLALKKKSPSSDEGSGIPRQPKEGKIIGPSAGLLRNLHKVAAYHCQTIVFTVINKTSDKAKHAWIEKYFHGNVSENIIGACQQLVNGNEGFSNLYNNYEDDKGNHRVLKATCCGADASSIYVTGKDVTAQTLTTFGNEKAFSGHTIWAMSDKVSLSLKKALSLVHTLSLKLVLNDSTCRIVGYTSGKIEAFFMQAINRGMYLLDRNEKIFWNDDKILGRLKETLAEMG